MLIHAGLHAAFVICQGCSARLLFGYAVFHARVPQADGSHLSQVCSFGATTTKNLRGPSRNVTDLDRRLHVVGDGWTALLSGAEGREVVESIPNLFESSGIVKPNLVDQSPMIVEWNDGNVVKGAPTAGSRPIRVRRMMRIALASTLR